MNVTKTLALAAALLMPLHALADRKTTRPTNGNTTEIAVELDPLLQAKLIGTTYKMVSFNPEKKGAVYVSLLPNGHATRTELIGKPSVTHFFWRPASRDCIHIWRTDPLNKENNIWVCTLDPSGQGMSVFSHYHNKTIEAKALSN